MTKENQLIKAAQDGNLQKVKQLVEQGVDIHADDDLALRSAKHYNHYKVIRYLEALQSTQQYKRIYN